MSCYSEMQRNHFPRVKLLIWSQLFQNYYYGNNNNGENSAVKLLQSIASWENLPFFGFEHFNPCFPPFTVSPSQAAIAPRIDATPWRGRIYVIIAMLIKEYRIPLPLSVEEYRIAQLYMIQKKSRQVNRGWSLCARCILLHAWRNVLTCSDWLSQ